jgi:hypothetical protein
MVEVQLLLPNRAFGVTRFSDSSQVIFNHVSSRGMIIVMTSHCG